MYIQHNILYTCIYKMGRNCWRGSTFCFSRHHSCWLFFVTNVL